jgi:hypothetical protein
MQRVGENEYECLEETDVMDPAIYQMKPVEEINFNFDKRLEISQIIGVQLPDLVERLEPPPETVDAEE